jgi:WD40 repeat protein/DNA-binding SARP family transcriptional activator
MPHLSLALLGTFRATLDGKPIAGFESIKVRALLAYLAVTTNRIHSRETVAGLLWPDFSNRAALTNLRNALSNLRDLLHDRQARPPFLLVTRDTIQFNLASDYSLDLTNFQNLSSLEVDRLQPAIALYRGVFLEGFSCDSAPFEEWVVLTREQTSQQVLRALRALTAHHEQYAEYEQAQVDARKQLELEPWDEQAYQQLMRALAFSGRRSEALSEYETCRRRLKQELGVEPASETMALYESIRDETLKPMAALRVEAEAPAPGAPPFKGLHYFDEVDADSFFGRELLTAQLVGEVRKFLSPESRGVRFLTIIGASGSGKSSIVRAGLVPALKRGEFRGPIHIITPTEHPLESLAASLTDESESVTATATLIDDLARDPRSLHLYGLKLLGDSKSRFLLVVDQFEELYSLCRSETERKAFVDNLIAAASVDDGSIIVVIALRADFYAHCAPFENLRAAMCQRQVYIGSMSAGELRQAIEEPARCNEWTFESGLVELFLRDAGNEPGALPLLSHALLETWRRRRGRSLTFSGYAESGGVRGAIAQTADLLFKRLAPEQQSIARSIFLRLTELGEGTQDTRRRAALTELVLRPADALAVQAVLKTLADARLITTAEGTAEVAHEALIREWATLREWLNENREGLRLHRRLTEAAQEWDKLNRDEGALYRGARLAQALEWADTHADELNELERTFLGASQAWAEREVAEREAQRQRELDAALKLAEAEKQRAEEQAHAAQQLRQEREVAEQQARLATSRELAAAAVSNLQVDPERSVLLALQALSKADTLEAQNSLHQALPELHILQTIPAHDSAVTGVAFSPDGTRIATSSADKTAKVWDAATGKLLLTLKTDVDVWDVTFSPDGKRLATSGFTDVIIWDASTGQKLFTLVGQSPGGATGFDIGVGRIRFSPDGTRLAVANQDGVPKVWDLSTRSEVFAPTGHKQICKAIAYSPDGKLLATGCDDGIVKLWDAQTGKELFTLTGHTNMIRGFAFSPDGQRLASVGEDAKLKIWDVATGKELLKLNNPSAGGFRSAVFMPDGKSLVAAGYDGTAKMWDAASGRQLLILAGHNSTVLDVALSPDGKRLASVSADTTLRIWDPGPGRELLTLIVHTAGVNGVSYSPDGTQLVTAAEDGAVKIWDPASGQLRRTFASDRPHPWSGLAYNSDGKRVATGSWDGIACVWDVATGQSVTTLIGHTNSIRSVAFSPDGKCLATASLDGTAKVWDLNSGEALVTFRNHIHPEGTAQTNSVWSAAFSPDGKRVATGGFDAVRVWDATSGQELLSLPGQGNALIFTGVAFSPDGKLVAVGQFNGLVVLWDAASGNLLCTFPGHSAGVAQVVFGADGTRLTSASFDKLAKVWDVKTGQELASLYGNAANVYSVSFSPDGTHLATAGTDGTARIYTLRIEDLVEVARSRVTRTLTTEECRKYLHLEQCPSAP